MSSISFLDSRVAAAFFGRFKQLRPPQEATIEPLLNGRNLVLSAGTGSGKTEAAIAPLLSRYWKSAIRTDTLTILYIAPTKALVNDIENRIYLPLSYLGLRVGVRHGDRDDLASGQTPHVLVTTPESLDVLLFRKDAALNTVKAVIVDEVHLLYNTQRGLQLSILLQRLKQSLTHDLQWVALSATVGRLPYIRDFFFGRDEQAEFFQFPAQRTIDAHIRQISDESSFLRLIRLLTQRPVKLLIFTNARKECERLAGYLRQDKQLKAEVFVHYSSLSSNVRVETEQNFSKSNSAICIATSTLELGIDIGDIDAVLLWGVPSGVESFLQRIGRGNRRSYKTNVVCLVNNDSEIPLGEVLRFMAIIDAGKRGELSIKAPFELFGAVGQQFLSVIASDGGRFTRIADLCKLIAHKDSLGRPMAEQILAELSDKNYLQPHGFKNQYGADEKLYKLVDFRLIYGNYRAGTQLIDVCHGSKLLGTVPIINLLKIRRGVQVQFAGKRWKVINFSSKSIILEPSQDRGSIIHFTYPGGSIGFDAFLTNRMWQLLHSDEFPVYLVENNLRDRISYARDRIRKVCNVNNILYTQTLDGIRYYTFAGYLVNKAVALISEQPEYKADDISLMVPVPINWRSIPCYQMGYEPIFHLLFEVSSEQSIYQSLLPPELQFHEFLQEWLKDETIPNILERLARSSPLKINPGIIHMIDK